jgi:hypothetical protein
MSGATGKLVLHHRSAGAAMGTLDAFFVMRCFGAVSPQDIQATLKCAEVLRAYRPQGSASIVVVDPTSTFPSEETRRVAHKISRETNAQTLGLAVVIQGDGFWASAIRGVVMTLTALSPTNAAHPRKVFRHEEDGVHWIIETIGESSPKYRSVLLAALTQLKSTATSPPPSSNLPPPTSTAPRAASKVPPPSKVPPSSKRKVG